MTSTQAFVYPSCPSLGFRSRIPSTVPSACGIMWGLGVLWSSIAEETDFEALFAIVSHGSHVPSGISLSLAINTYSVNDSEDEAKESRWSMRTMQGITY